MNLKAKAMPHRHADKIMREQHTRLLKALGAIDRTDPVTAALEEKSYRTFKRSALKLRQLGQ